MTRLPWYRLLLLTSLLLWSRTADAQHVFPILLYGPNNQHISSTYFTPEFLYAALQKRDLRHILALTKQLDMHLILTGVFKHYLDTRALRHQRAMKLRGMRVNDASPYPSCFPPSEEGFMPLSQVVDRTPLNAWISTATVAELKARGWDGQLDALVHPSNRPLTALQSYINKSLAAGNVTMKAEAPIYSVQPGLDCNATSLAQFRDKLKPHRYIGLVMVLLGRYEKSSNLTMEQLKPMPQDQCNHNIYQADRLLRPAPWISTLADRYITQHITPPGGALHPAASTAGNFMAVHIRPYPDECMELWKYKNFDSNALQQACGTNHGSLHQQIGPCVAKALQATGTKTLFILAHPGIRSTVDELLLKAGVSSAKYLEAPLVSRLAECDDQTATFQLMVEEAIAVQAPFFMGTHSSSITHNIVLQRLSMKHEFNSFLDIGTC